jgi:hypothetical protein
MRLFLPLILALTLCPPVLAETAYTLTQPEKTAVIQALVASKPNPGYCAMASFVVPGSSQFLLGDLPRAALSLATYGVLMLGVPSLTMVNQDTRTGILSVGMVVVGGFSALDAFTLAQGQRERNQQSLELLERGDP